MYICCQVITTENAEETKTSPSESNLVSTEDESSLVQVNTPGKIKHLHLSAVLVCVFPRAFLSYKALETSNEIQTKFLENSEN